MQRLPSLTRREKIILLIFIFSGIAVLGLYFGLGVLQDGLPVRAAPQGRVEIAVLLPFEEEQAIFRESVSGIVQQAINNLPAEIELAGVQQIAITEYDSQGTPDGAAGAARQAARNPETIAIIGPLDARRSLAAAESLRGDILAVITPSSTAPTLPVETYRGLYRMPAADDLQGQAIVTFLDANLERTNIFLIASPSAYVQRVLEVFNLAAQDRLRIVGTLDLSQAPPVDEINTQIIDSQANAIVYLGGLEDIDIVLGALSHPEIDLPVVACDIVNDPALLPLVDETVEIYYTSPILNMAGLLEEASLQNHREVLGEVAGLPFAYETTQAVWALFAALSLQEEGQTPRQAVWDNLEGITLNGVGGDTFAFLDGQWFPGVTYIYQVDPATGDWYSNPVVDWVVESR